MRIAKEELPVKIDVPGAKARQQVDFGDATGYGKLGGEYFTLAGGTDISELLKGLEGDLCQSPHWGYLIKGELAVTYDNGTDENVHSGDLFYWPPGHSVKAVDDSDFVLFSPEHEHTPVLEHINRKLHS